MNSTHVANLEELAELIGNLTITEAVELRKILKEKFGVEDAKIVTKIITPEVNGYPNESSLFEVKMISCGPEKIKAIKAVKILTGMGLTEAKYFVENLPRVLIQQTSIADAKRIKQEFDAFGSTIDIIPL